LFHALRLAHAAQDQTSVTDDRRIAHVDRIERGRLVARQQVHVRAGCTQRLDEQIMLARRAFEIRRGGESQGLPLAGDRLPIDKGIAWMFDGHAYQAIDLRQNDSHFLPAGEDSLTLEKPDREPHEADVDDEEAERDPENHRAGQLDTAEHLPEQERRNWQDHEDAELLRGPCIVYARRDADA